MTSIVSVNILTLPNDGGSAITDLEYRVNAGAAISLGETTTGSYPITADEGDDIQIRAVNAIGAGDWSDVKAVPADAFNPATLFASGEQGAWYDPSDLSTMFTDTDGTTPAAVGDPVARINDKSGRGNHATQATAAARPILRQTAGGLYYLEFDGVDDALATAALPAPGVDKAQMFAGVRKLAGSGTQIVAEYSSASSTNNGAFGLFAPTSLLANSYAFQSKGSTGAAAAVIGGYPPPISNILTGVGDISNRLSALRVDSTQMAQNTDNQGTGNYLAYSLFIGSRAGTTFFLNGHIYSLIVRFGANLDTPTIENVEGFVADKTGVTL